MIDYIIPILALSILVLGALYKVFTQKDLPEEVDKERSVYKEREEIKGRVINDHIAEIMNIKKKK